MDMFIKALKGMGTLDMLFYVRPEMQVNNDVVKRSEKQLSDYFDAKITLDLCNQAPISPPKGLWREYCSPALSIANLPPYLQTARYEQVSAARRFLSRDLDILFVHRLTSMVPVLLSKMPRPRTYFDLDDIEHLAFYRSIGQPPLWAGKPLFYLRLPLIKRWERRAIRASHSTFVCSDLDRQYLSRKFGYDNVVEIPNAVELPKVTSCRHKQTLLFIGLLSYHPNTIAADHLVENIWPTVLSILPEARLIIAGARPEYLTSYRKSPKGVTFVGFVDDLGKLYEEVTAVCCPILFGSGTRIKILEAAAYGKPVVSTTLGAEGIDLKDGEEILLRDDPKAFAEACTQLLTNESLTIRIGQQARSVIESKYVCPVVIRKIRNAVKNGDGS
jgi:glycosyltransferase involved in cell wall biosynthesis